MNIFGKKLLLPISLAAIVAACSSGGGGDFAGIGGSGFVSTGTVTGFGSVFVNGVEFDTGSTVFEVEDANGSQDDLRIGMVVQVQGTINSDGVTGTATGIRYGDDVQGPVANISTSADGTQKTFTVFGIDVSASSTDTAFENLTFAALANDQVVEVSGFFDGSGALQATYIEKKADTYNAQTVFELNGRISNLSGTTFTVYGVNVNAASANLEDLPNGLQNNVRVEVKGSYDAASNTIVASRVEGEDISYEEDGHEVSIEGYITRYVSPADFDINGFTIDGGTADLEPAGLVLAVGLRVEAEGTIVNGVLVAEDIETRAGGSEINARVLDKDAASNSFRLQLDGQPLTVVLTTATQMRDENDNAPDENLSFDEINPGDYMFIRGFESGVNSLTATRVKRDNDEDVRIQLQGTLTAQLLDDSVTVLGVAYSVNGSTQFDPYVDHAAFIAAVNGMTTQPVVTIRDNNNDGFADSVTINP